MMAGERGKFTSTFRDFSPHKRCEYSHSIHHLTKFAGQGLGVSQNWSTKLASFPECQNISGELLVAGINMFI